MQTSDDRSQAVQKTAGDVIRNLVEEVQTLRKESVDNARTRKIAEIADRAELRGLIDEDSRVDFVTTLEEKTAHELEVAEQGVEFAAAAPEIGTLSLDKEASAGFTGEGNVLDTYLDSCAQGVG